MAKLTLGVFGDAGNSFYNANSYYYKPGWYQLYNSGGTAPVQAAVADMVRSWGVSELIQLGDTAYNAQSSSLLDYNIGKYYNDYMQPYGNKPNEFAYADLNSVYSTATGGIVAEPGKLQWPYNLYNFPYGFPNPANGGAGGSSDGLNHFWALQGNHDYGTILGKYYDYNVNQVDNGNLYIGMPEGPDAFDYQNNIIKSDPPPIGTKYTKKTGSAQQLLDYLPLLQTGDDAVQPSYLKPGQVRIGSNDPNGYDGIYYSVDLGEISSEGTSRPLLHVVMLDTPRIMTDAGYYNFNNKDKKEEAKERNAQLNLKGEDELTASNYHFDPTSSTQYALFPNPEAALTAPSASYNMFSWVKQDLAQSKALFNIVTGHHTGYHGGAVPEDANSNNFSSPIMVKFLAGLKDEYGEPLLDAYMNGHSHAYSRVLEMEQTSDGIGAGIPILTTGNGGKDQDPLNLVPYGTNVLEPQNWDNTFTFSYTDEKGQVVSGEMSNAEHNGLDANYLGAFPQAAAPTSVGSSGSYRYNYNNIPQGFQLSANPNNADDDPKLVATYQTTITVAAENQNPLSKTKEFTKILFPQYNSVLPDSAGANSSISGLYGYGSGAALVEVDDGYLFMNYRTAVPLDPAITLIGKQQGLSAEQMQRGSLFFERWSPSNAKVDNLALFSFDVMMDDDANNPQGYLDHLQLVQAGNGYLEQSIGSNVYQDGTYTFEIQGNNPTRPLPSDQSDPTRAAVELTFAAGQLKAVRFAKDGNGNERKGTGYKELANSINGDNLNQSGKKSMLVGINVNLEAQYTFADQAAPGSDLYQDWYMLADTAIQSKASQQGPFGGLSLDLRPSAQRAREIIATQPLTTGYSGSGAQAAYAAPQQGTVTIKDALGTIVGGGSKQAFNNGNVNLNLSRLAAPGALQLEFGGDPFSSYQVNYKEATTKLNINYLPWESGISAGPDQSLQFSTDVTLNVNRSDAQSGAISFGLRSTTAESPFWLLQDSDSASASALTINRLFTPSGSGSWLASEGERQGSTSAQRTLGAGTWVPVATDSNGKSLGLESVSVAGNAVQVEFEGGYQARYSTPSTGAAAAMPDNQSLVMTVQNLGGYRNGLALYEADPVTGAIIAAGGEMLLPADNDYLESALENATAKGLYFSPDELPAYQTEKVFQSLPLMANSNYAVLLVRQNNRDDLASSFSQANTDGQVIAQSFAALGRGVTFCMEDLRSEFSDQDFNDVIVTLSSSQFMIV